MTLLRLSLLTCWLVDLLTCFFLCKRENERSISTDNMLRMSLTLLLRILSNKKGCTRITIKIPLFISYRRRDTTVCVYTTRRYNRYDNIMMGSRSNNRWKVKGERWRVIPLELDHRRMNGQRCGRCKRANSNKPRTLSDWLHPLEVSTEHRTDETHEKPTLSHRRHRWTDWDWLDANMISSFYYAININRKVYMRSEFCQEQKIRHGIANFVRMILK